MNLGLISLICLLAAIVIGFVKNCNVGILCTGIAAVLALVFGIKASDIIKGFSASLCIQMVAIPFSSRISSVKCIPVHPDGRYYLSVCNN